MKIEKILYLFMGVFAFVFCISIYVLLFQSIGIDDSNKATIFGGALGMVGGLLGALGAYYASVNQMKEEFSRRDEEIKINSRPIVNCSIISNVRENLSNINYDKSTILFSEKNLSQTNPETFVNLFTIKFSGNCNIIKNIEIFLTKNNEFLKYHLASINPDVEILIIIPTNTDENINKEKIEISFTTERQEKMKYIYDNINLKEHCYLLEDNNEKSLYSYEFKKSSWELLGRNKK